MAVPDQSSGTNAFPWRFVTPLFMGSTLNPINSSLIARPWCRGMRVWIGCSREYASSAGLPG